MKMRVGGCKKLRLDITHDDESFSFELVSLAQIPTFFGPSQKPAVCISIWGNRSGERTRFQHYWERISLRKKLNYIIAVNRHDNWAAMSCEFSSAEYKIVVKGKSIKNVPRLYRDNLLEIGDISILNLIVLAWITWKYNPIHSNNFLQSVIPNKLFITLIKW